MWGVATINISDLFTKSFLLYTVLCVHSLRHVYPSVCNNHLAFGVEFKSVLRKVGATVKTKNNELRIIGTNKIKNIKLTTSPYPGFPTDLQAQLMVLLCKSFGRSEIVEKIFENRFMHASELNRMGAKIKIIGNKAIIEGNVNFKAAELMATDLRASVSLILAALTTKGKSIVNRIYHLDRGYESLEQKLRNAGAKIKRIS